MQDVEFFVITLVKWIGYLVVVYGFIKAVLNDWDKKKKEQQLLKSEAEKKSHEPLEQSIQEIKEELSSMNKKIDRSLEINAANAELALSVADETAAHEVTNGRTKEAAAALRKVIYEKVRE